jgi:hypothetical protein
MMPQQIGPLKNILCSDTFLVARMPLATTHVLNYNPAFPPNGNWPNRILVANNQLQKGLFHWFNCTALVVSSVIIAKTGRKSNVATMGQVECFVTTKKSDCRGCPCTWSGSQKNPIEGNIAT